MHSWTTARCSFPSIRARTPTRWRTSSTAPWTSSTGKPEGNKKAYYDGIRKELLEKTDALYDQLSEAVKKGLGE